MAITFVGAGAGAAAGTGDITPALPGGFAADDLLLVAVYARVAGITIAQPSGWSTAYDEAPGGGGHLSLFYKIAAGGDSDPLIDQSGTNSIVAQCAAFRGIDLVTPFDSHGTLRNYTASDLVDIGPITAASASDANGLVIVIGGKQDDFTSVATLSGDSLTWNEIGEVPTALGTDAWLVWDYAIWSGGAPTLTDKTFSITGGTAVPHMGRMSLVNEAAAAGQPTRKRFGGIPFARFSPGVW